MAEEKQRRGHFAPVWGIFLVFLGIVFLLQSLNILSWGLWGTLWHFWPVLIILAGLGILLRRFNVWLVSLLILALLFACLGIAIWQYGPSSPAGQTTKSYSQPLDGLEKAQIEIDFTMGSLTMSSLSANSLNFVEAESRVTNKNKSMRVDFSRQGSEGKLFLSKEGAGWPFWDESEGKWQVRLARNIPLAVNVKSALSNVVLDLSQLQVTELEMDADLGNYTMKMPSLAGTTHASIKADLDLPPELVSLPVRVQSLFQHTPLVSFRSMSYVV
jgi:hypothetical protein